MSKPTLKPLAKTQDRQVQVAVGSDVTTSPSFSPTSTGGGQRCPRPVTEDEHYAELADAADEERLSRYNGAL